MANILVQIELTDGQPDPRCLGLINEGRAIASKLGATLYATLPCDTPPSYGDNDIIAVLSRHGVDKVILLSHPDLGGDLSAAQREITLRMACDRFPPRLVLIPASDNNMVLAAGLAMHLEGQFTDMAALGFSEALGQDGDGDGNGEENALPYGMRILDACEGPLVLTLDHDGDLLHLGDEEAEVVVLHPRMPGDKERVPGEPADGEDPCEEEAPFSTEEVTADEAPEQSVDPDAPTPDPGPLTVAVGDLKK